MGCQPSHISNGENGIGVMELDRNNNKNKRKKRETESSRVRESNGQVSAFNKVSLISISIKHAKSLFNSKDNQT